MLVKLAHTMNYTSTKNAFWELIKPESLYLKVISLCLLMQMLNWGEAYRAIAYLNLVIVSIYAYRAIVFGSDIELKKALIWVLAIPIVFLVLHSISILEFEFIKEIRHTIIAVFLAFGIYLFARKNSAYIKQTIWFHLVVIVFSYILIQLVAIILFDKPNGTTKNPHYLALYSSLTLVFCVYSFFNSPFRLKIFFAFAILLLGFVLLQTGSRPAWIGVIFSGGLALLFLEGSARKVLALIFSLILAILFTTNAGDFSGKVSDLALNITKEERVTIWQDTWEMQKSSTPFQWVFGHGLDSFEADFKEYSRYHLKNIDFNSPHNFLLEMIYISGVLGLGVFLYIYIYIYKKLFTGIQLKTANSHIYLLLMLLFTCNLILTSITIPFFTSFNLNIIAIVTGSIMFLDKAATLK